MDAILIDTTKPRLFVKLNLPLSSVIVLIFMGSNVIVAPSKGRCVLLSNTTDLNVFWGNAETLKRVNKININFLGIF